MLCLHGSPVSLWLTSRCRTHFRAGFVPAAIYLCSQWYPRQKLAFRLSCFMALASAAGALCGLLASSIGKLGGKTGLSSWKWIFLVEGSATVSVGIASLFFLTGPPNEDIRWLTDDERRYIRIMSIIKGSDREPPADTSDGTSRFLTQGRRYCKALKDVASD